MVKNNSNSILSEFVHFYSSSLKEMAKIIGKVEYIRVSKFSACKKRSHKILR